MARIISRSRGVLEAGANCCLALCLAISGCDEAGPGASPDSGSADGKIEASLTDTQAPDSAPVPSRRIFSSTDSVLGCPDFSPCDPGSCATNELCFHVTDELHVCDARSILAPTCQPGPGHSLGEVECGCAVGDAAAAECPSGQVCRQTDHCLGGGNAGATELHCVTVCSAPVDCPSGTTCVPSSLIYDAGCVAVSCHTDLQCDAAPGGVCGMIIARGSQCGDWFVWGTRCVYPATGDGGAPCADPWQLRGCPDLNPSDEYYGCVP